MTISKLLRPVYVAKIKKLARGELQNPSQKLDNLGNPHGTRLVNHDQYRACGPGGHAAAQAQSGLPPRDSEAGLQATTASCSASTGGSGSNPVSAGSQSSFLDPSSRARAVPQRNTSQGAPAPFPIAPQSAAATSISAPSLAINLEPQHQRLQDLLLQEYQQQLQLLSLILLLSSLLPTSTQAELCIGSQCKQPRSYTQSSAAPCPQRCLPLSVSTPNFRRARTQATASSLGRASRPSRYSDVIYKN
jgi:hypothetical protein